MGNIILYFTQEISRALFPFHFLLTSFFIHSTIYICMQATTEIAHERSCLSKWFRNNNNNNKTSNKNPQTRTHTYVQANTIKRD